MPLYIILNIMLACLMLFAALSNAVCLHSAYFLQIFLILFFIMHSAFNLLVFLILCSHPFIERAMCSLEK